MEIVSEMPGLIANSCLVGKMDCRLCSNPRRFVHYNELDTNGVMFNVGPWH